MKKLSIVNLILCVITSFVVFITATLFPSCSKNKITTVGFYDLPETYSAVIQDIITKNTDSKFQFVQLEEKDFISNNLPKTVDMVFCYNDANVQNLKEWAVELPKDVKNRIPQTIRNSEFYNFKKELRVFPVAIDQFETSILKTTVSRYEIPVPETVKELGDFGHTAKFYYPIPFIIAAEEDININSLLTLLVEAYGGKEGYKNVVSKLQEIKDFSDLYNIKIGGDAADDVTIATVLDVIKEWEKEYIFSPNWKNMTLKQAANLIVDNRVALSFMNLSEHRTKPMPYITYFSSLPFPAQTAKTRVSLQPVVTGMAFKNSEATRIIMNRISLPEAQEEISLQTKIGPAMLQGTSCDIQADDARYLSAITEGGPVPDLGTAAFATKEKRHLLAEAVRNYF